MVAPAQFPMPRAASYPAGTLGNASRQHRLTLDEAKAVRTAARALDAQADSSLLSDDSAVVVVLAKIGRQPRLTRAIADVHLTPRTFIIALAALREAMETALMQEMAGPKSYPMRGPAENLALLEAHASEFGLPLQSAAREAPATGSLDLAAAGHRLTVEEIHRVLAVARDFGRKDALAVMIPEPYSESGLLEDEVQGLTADAPRLRTVRAHGFSPHAYLVARAALRATLIAVVGARTKVAMNGLPTATAGNIALFRDNAAELNRTFGLKTPEEQAGERDRGEMVYRRRVRMVDSLSRFVRTDSLARLFARAVDGPDDAIPAIAREITCERSRLSWRHGMAPASVAMRRMNDSLWNGHPDRYARMSERLSRYEGPRPASDEACGHTRWPRAPDSLMIEPRPGAMP